jgi:hypothetical protein
VPVQPEDSSELVKHIAVIIELVETVPFYLLCRQINLIIYLQYKTRMFHPSYGATARDGPRPPHILEVT